jgi:hypothetical protein
MSILERLLALLPPSPIDSELLEALGFFADANKDLRNVINQQATSLDQTRQALRGAKTCANKFACLALLGFGLIAIEAQALTLYFLQG